MDTYQNTLWRVRAVRPDAYDARTVQRSIRKMQDLNLIMRESVVSEDGTTRSVLNLSSLVERLSSFARRDTNYVVRMRRKEVV